MVKKMSSLKKINVNTSVFNSLATKKGNIEKIINKKLSYNDLMKLLLEDEKKIMIVPKRRRRRAFLEEIYPIVHI